MQRSYKYWKSTARACNLSDVFGFLNANEDWPLGNIRAEIILRQTQRALDRAKICNHDSFQHALVLRARLKVKGRILL